MTAGEPYYSDDLVTLYHGDCCEITEWLEADVLVTDPPYGRGWTQPDVNSSRGWSACGHDGIANDSDSSVRDAALTAWGRRPGAVFGHLMRPPSDVRQVVIYAKPANSGAFGTFGGFRRDVEGIFLVGSWPQGSPGRSSVLRTSVPTTERLGVRGHPHGKPLDVLAALIAAAPDGMVADPFAGSGSTLVAAKQLGRKAVGVELDERYCEIAARRLSQGVLDFGGAA